MAPRITKPASHNFTPQAIESPCVRLCTLDHDNVCVGCYRSIDEICAWGNASDDERRAILRAVELRRDSRQQRAWSRPAQPQSPDGRRR